MKRSGSLSHARALGGGTSPASQTLVRGLDVLEMIASEPMGLPALAHRLGLARSTAHRLATALLERRYLTLVPREGYGLGPKLLELGFCAREQTLLVRLARPYLQALAAETKDTVHLSVWDAGTALLLECIQGKRRLLPLLRIGERAGLTRSATGCTLLLDGPEEAWRAAHSDDAGPDPADPGEQFIDRQRHFASLGYSFEPAETSEQLRTLAAPVRGADGAILAAVGLSAAAQYLDDSRLEAVAAAVCRTAAAISAELGVQMPKPGPPRARGEVYTGPLPNPAGNVQDNEAIAASRAHKSLEAGPARGHDPLVNGTRRAKKSDLGAT